MSAASKDLYAFLHAAIWGICDYQDEVQIEVCETPPKTVTLTVHCNPKDLKFVYAKAKHLKVIAIAIAQRHKSVVNILVADDGDDDEEE